jgi:hypothetical protein
MLAAYDPAALHILGEACGWGGTREGLVGLRAGDWWPRWGFAIPASKVAAPADLRNRIRPRTGGYLQITRG